MREGGTEKIKERCGKMEGKEGIWAILASISKSSRLNAALKSEQKWAMLGTSHIPWISAKKKKNLNRVQWHHLISVLLPIDLKI